MLQPSPMAGERSKFSTERSCKFGTIVRVLWPDSPVAKLAQRAGCSKRAAQYWIDGQRKPSARALAAIVNEIFD